MAEKPIKILFFSDSHLGYDLPIKPRVQRRRRGHDFFNNYHHILEFAQTEKVDLIIHGGDVFFRSIVAPSVIERAYEPLLNVANSGIPIYLVPGNHERSKLPGHLWLAHDNIHVFDRPRTYRQQIGEASIALSGFPFVRKVKGNFPTLLQQTNYLGCKRNIHFLCLHQAFEGAKVGPSDYTFRVGPDNIPPSDVPDVFAAVLSGHIHRGQKLTRTLENQPIAVPIVYPGSIERTSFAEREEVKFFVIINIYPNSGNLYMDIGYHRLSTRPMVKIDIPTTGKIGESIQDLLQNKISTLDPNSIVRVHLVGPNADQSRSVLSAADLRAVAPETMNISLAYTWTNAK